MRTRLCIQPVRHSCAHAGIDDWITGSAVFPGTEMVWPVLPGKAQMQCCNFLERASGLLHRRWYENSRQPSSWRELLDPCPCRASGSLCACHI